MDRLPPERHRLAPDRHPTPFSAEQIRTACAPGHRLVHRTVTVGGETFSEEWVFTGGDAEWAEMRHRRLDAPGDEGAARARWTDLQAHASFPVATTTVAADEVTTPAGSFAAWCYTVSAGPGQVTRFWFAVALPGPPVLMITTNDGAEVLRYELIEVGAS